MIGRVPIGGQVRDPIPFRVLVGQDNLAASGLRVPDEIIGMVFEGTAVGDWTLSCVEGSLHTATFVFEDGTIRTVSTRAGSTNARANGETERLGFVADKFGTPCISGRKISNWKELMALRVALRTGAAAAEAAAAAETTTVIGGATGTITTAVDGSTGRFVLGRAVAEGTEEVDRAIAERLSNQFDAIFVENGQEIVLLIQKEIAIDYDPVGRKLDYAAATMLGTRRTSFLD
jgi:integrating conjugative element protein (TIGR03752 family)